MKPIAALLFGAGLLLAVRVMFYGVRREIDLETFTTRAWPLSVASVMGAAGAILYLQARSGSAVTGISVAMVVLLSALAGGAAWWTVKQSVISAKRSPDPEEDPRYRFQGHVARIASAIRDMQSSGRITLVIDGRTLEFAARWLQGTTASVQDGTVDREVVIERIDGDVAFVEPWALVESRL